MNPYVKQARKSREDLVLEHAPLIKRVVNRIAIRLPPEVEKDDLHQAGAMGLLDAIDKFDPTKDVQFKTYAELRIKGAILDELRSRDWIPRSVRSAATQLEKAMTELTAKLTREPTDREMAKAMNMSLKEYHEFLAKARPIPLVSLEDLGAGGGDDDAQDIMEVLSDPDNEDPFAIAALRDMKAHLAEAITKLPEQEQMVLSLYYIEEMNMKEIGEILGISESRVSQIRTKSIVKLRASLKNSA